MGTLFEQAPRHETLDQHIAQITGVLRDNMKLDPRTASPSQWSAACDVVRTALAVQSADVMDEQLAGFGKLLRDLIETLGSRS